MIYLLCEGTRSSTKSLYNNLFKLLLSTIRQARRANRLVIYIDEVVFTKHTNFTHDWSSLNNNTCVPETDMYTSYRAVLAGISHQGGVEAIM